MFGVTRHVIASVVANSRIISASYFLKASYGNDSVAMIQWAHERGLRDVIVLYSDTGWSASWWTDRVAQGEALASSYGFETVRIASIGFKELVRQRKGFPRQGIQFCTEMLKIVPSQRAMDTIDPRRERSVLVGKRREESANRADTAERIDSSPLDGGRKLWHPLVAMTEQDRNDLVKRAGFDVLPHRSMECFPCINANRADIRMLDDARISEIAEFEAEMGFTSKGKPRTMFRPYRYMGATGIREIKRWADSERGEFSLRDGTANEDEQCSSGQCGL